MIKTRAIVLHRFPYSDSSFIVKALTEESGIVSFIVKGGKKKESPFRGALDPLALSEVVFRQNPNTDLQFIKEATLLDWRKNLRNDLLSTAKAQVMTEMILRYAPQGVPLQEEFERLEQAIFRALVNIECSRQVAYFCTVAPGHLRYVGLQSRPHYLQPLLSHARQTCRRLFPRNRRIRMPSMPRHRAPARKIRNAQWTLGATNRRQNRAPRIHRKRAPHLLAPSHRIPQGNPLHKILERDTKAVWPVVNGL